MSSNTDIWNVKARKQKPVRSRNIRRVLYLNEAEDKELRRLTGELDESFAGTMRALLFKARHSKGSVVIERQATAPHVVIDSPQLAELGSEQRRMGCNLNQCAVALNGIAKALHQGTASSANAEDLVAIKEQLKELNRSAEQQQRALADYIAATQTRPEEVHKG